MERSYSKKNSFGESFFEYGGLSGKVTRWQSENSKRAHRNLQNHKFSKLPENFPGKPLFKHEMTVLYKFMLIRRVNRDKYTDRNTLEFNNVIKFSEGSRGSSRLVKTRVPSAIAVGE